jgi:formate dehydrogenase alpha subunit
MVQLRLVQSLFHSGKYSTRSKGLLQVEGQGVLRINPVEAGKRSLKDGDRVRLSNERGAFTTTVKLAGRVPECAAWFPDHFAQEAMALFDCSVDPDTKVPYFRSTWVKIERHEARGERP